MNNTPNSPAQTPDDHTDQGGNYWALFTPGIWKLLHAVSHDMDPEDGCLAIQDLDDDIFTTAFTAFGIENLKELLADLKSERPPA